jgi:hypothetical protein
MTMFSSVASPGHRWKMFLPQAAATQGEELRMVGAVALARSGWLSCRAHGSVRTIPGPQRRSVLA